MLSTIGELFKSKKFCVAFIAALGTLVAMAFGTVTPEAGCQGLLLIAASYLGVQGLADIGKERAKIENGKK